MAYYFATKLYWNSKNISRKQWSFNLVRRRDGLTEDLWFIAIDRQFGSDMANVIPTWFDTSWSCSKRLHPDFNGVYCFLLVDAIWVIPTHSHHRRQIGLVLWWYFWYSSVCVCGLVYYLTDTEWYICYVSTLNR